MSTTKAFIDRLKGLRARTGLSQQKVADGLGMTKVGYQNYEYGRNVPSFTLLPRIATFFNVSSDYLLGLSDEPQLPDKETLALARQLQSYRNKTVEPAAQG